MGPVASQEAIKMSVLTAVASLMPTRRIRLKTHRTDQLRADAGDLLDPNGAVLAFGEVTGDRRQGRMLLWAMQ